jgi:hypothetical protein
MTLTRPIPAGGAVAALDPGRAKCGLVLSDGRRSAVVEALVMPPAATWRTLSQWHRQGRLVGVVLGDGTGSRDWRRRLDPLLPLAVVKERASTLDGRRRYWELFPARGLARWLPEGLRQPPRDWDDVVAQLLLERWLGHPLPRRIGGDGPDAAQNDARTVKA